MKLPRGVSAERLVKALGKLGYEFVWQRGSTQGFSIKDHLCIRSQFRCMVP